MTEKQKQKENEIKNIVVSLAKQLPELEKSGDIFSADILRFDLIDLLKSQGK